MDKKSQSAVVLGVVWALFCATSAEPLTVCSEPFDCFGTSLDFVHPINRPINLLPESASKVNTTFYLYSKWLRADQKTSAKMPKICLGTALKRDQIFTPCVFTTNHLLDSSQLCETVKEVHLLNNRKQQPTGWTAIVVHGFLDSLHGGSWMSTIKNGLLRTGPEQSYDIVVLTDWTGGNGIPYLQATANTRLVGSQIAYFLLKLQKCLGIDIRKTHIIGHSLGAHIAAYASKKFVSPKLGRISALDPAGPNFEGMPKTVRLDRDDALLVDAIHTNAKPLYRLGYGMSEPVGHIDFYPSGGSDQPGCDISALPIAFERLMRSPENLLSHIGELGQLVTCSHLRAIDYFVESITASECHFESVQCKDWSQYLEGKCPACNGTNCARMGFRAYEWARQMADAKLNHLNASRKFYLETNREAPFCKK